MRIVHIAGAFYPARAYGGAIDSLLKMVKAQAKAGADVLVITTDADGRNRSVCRDWAEERLRVRYFKATPLNSYGISVALWRQIAAEARRVDVMHCHGLFQASTTVALWSGVLARTPCIVSPHGSLMRWAYARRRIRSRAYGLLDEVPLRAATLHATSDAEANDLRYLGYSRVVTIPGGIDAAFFQERSTPGIRSGLGLRSDQVLVSWLGRFAPVKNLEVLIAATRGMDVHLALAGDHHTSYGKTILEEVRRSGRKDVHFLGYLDQEQKRALLQESDVYVQPSHMESYCNSIAEALATGCPVVASTGTPWKCLDESGAGKWVPPTPEALGEAIRQVLRETGPRQRDAAVRIGRENDWSERARSMLSVYARVARSRHRA